MSNFNKFQLSRVLKEAKAFQPVNHQFEVNPYLNNEEMVEFCAKNNISVTAYSPLGNPSAPPTRNWTDKHVPLIKGPYLKFSELSSAPSESEVPIGRYDNPVDPSYQSKC